MCTSAAHSMHDISTRSQEAYLHLQTQTIEQINSNNFGDRRGQPIKIMDAMILFYIFCVPRHPES